MDIVLSVGQTITLAILVIYFGNWLTRRVPFLAENRIPEAVSGGLVAALVLGLLQVAGLKFVQDTALRDGLLLIFFTTLGLSVQASLLRQGGRPFLILSFVAALAVVLQNVVGVAIAALSGTDPRYGLVTGSIALAGGIGTAIAWGEPLAQAGVTGATEAGIAMATLGLVAGGLLGGPVASILIRRHGLTSRLADNTDHSVGQKMDRADLAITPEQAMHALLVLAVTIGPALTFARWAHAEGSVLPTFVFCLLSGVVISALGRRIFRFLEPWPGDGPTLALVNQVSLSLFLAMSLMATDFVRLAPFLLQLAVMAAAQVLLMVFVLVPLCFRLMGRDYDAAICSSGILGLGLGATPTAIATMTAVTSRYGPSPLAFILIPLIGAVLIDTVNAVVISGALTLLD